MNCLLITKLVDLIRTAVAPDNIERAAKLGKALKSRGFKVAFNLMYMSQWGKDVEFIKKLNQLEGEVDFIYMVDSFGGVYPEDVKEALDIIKKEVKIPIGFHGHNNMELGLANSLVALENGCNIVDATITGMGRGAGNLKTELLLTSLNSKEIIHVDFNKLNPIVAEFEKCRNIIYGVPACHRPFQEHIPSSKRCDELDFRIKEGLLLKA